jgi:hypothetical protein
MNGAACGILYQIQYTTPYTNCPNRSSAALVKSWKNWTVTPITKKHSIYNFTPRVVNHTDIMFTAAKPTLLEKTHHTTQHKKTDTNNPVASSPTITIFHIDTTIIRTHPVGTHILSFNSVFPVFNF